MTNEEAIFYMTLYKRRLEASVSSDMDEDIKAFDEAIKALEQSTQEVLEELRQEIWDIRSTHLDSQEYALIRKSDVMDIINKHLQEASGCQR